MFKHLIKSVVIASCFAVISQAQAGGSVWDKIQETYKGSLDITVYYSPTCGCCKDWLTHLDKHGFKIDAIELQDVNGIKQKHKLPRQVASCHTAFIDGYIIEGHVPADDIKRLLIDRPAIRGLSVPQMPVGTPGMEMGSRKDPFVVVSFDKEGTVAPYKQYWSY